MPAVDVVSQYLNAIEGENWDEVAQLLDDEIFFQSPKTSVTGKDKFLELMKVKHEEFKKNGPKWEGLTEGEQANQAITKGTVKMLMVKLSVKRTFDVTPEGKIGSIIVKKN
eukprot:GFYU01000403.1.p2 GENE.GFYU01000403.1~~GFYU01000403.1.p2  ORF type:complete len:111 (+),score=54.44 GFYU01000403.1:122-454(+)